MTCYQFQFRLGVHRKSVSKQQLSSPHSRRRLAGALREFSQSIFDFNPPRPVDVTYQLKPRPNAKRINP